MTLMAVHPTGEGSKTSNDDLHISFEPSPHYAGIAKAASGDRLWTAVTNSVDEFTRLLPAAVESVKAGRGAVLEVQLVDAHGAGGFYTASRI